MSSANIPFDIQLEIIKRILPVKSLIRFRSVSKIWKSLIDSSEFINDHSVKQSHQHNILVSYEDSPGEYKYVSIVDDDSFPQHNFSLDLSPTVKLLTRVIILDCSHGLVLLYGTSAVLGKRMFVIWNPSIRKTVGIVSSRDFRAIGFGVCPKTFDPKIVTISIRNIWICEANIFRISSGSWKTISLNMLTSPCRYQFGSCRFDQVVIDGIIYWVTSYSATNVILSFDLTSEEFGKVDLPENLAHDILSVSKLKESLVVLEFERDPVMFLKLLHVWKMVKNGDSDFSFEKLYTFSCLKDDGYELYDIIGFTKNGQGIWEHVCDADGSLVSTLVAYEPFTRCSTDLEIFVNSIGRFKMTSYTESLLLLNHTDSINPDDDGYISS